ncbi:MAG: VPLPA-CTERM sorting domain-containing protein, partial [Gammaproteobacteria bacterium]|nr:VPLPA-CTERM sorting domain-containing protein [Gammaproteobacteria bacterium]
NAAIGAVTDDAAVLIATPPWDDPDDSNFSDRGVLTPGLLSGIRVGTFNFVTDAGPVPIATLTFTAVGAVGSSTLITVGDGAGAGGGWSPPNDVYEAGTVNVVPIPAAVWLFGSGLLGLVGVARRRQV